MQLLSQERLVVVQEEPTSMLQHPSQERLVDEDTAEQTDSRAERQYSQMNERNKAEHKNSRAEQLCSQMDEDNRAEHQCRHAEGSSSNTQSIRQSPTIPGAVVRYVDVLVDNICLAKITPCNLGNRAERTESQAEPLCSQQCSQEDKKDRAERTDSRAEQQCSQMDEGNKTEHKNSRAEQLCSQMDDN